MGHVESAIGSSTRNRNRWCNSALNNEGCHVPMMLKQQGHLPNTARRWGGGVIIFWTSILLLSMYLPCWNKGADIVQIVVAHSLVNTPSSWTHGHFARQRLATATLLDEEVEFTFGWWLNKNYGLQVSNFWYSSIASDFLPDRDFLPNSNIAIFSRIAIFFRASESFRKYKYYNGNWFQFPTSETGFGFRHEFID